MRSRITSLLRSQRGLALVVVLWVLILLSLIAASFTKTTRTEINVTRNIIDNANAGAGGVRSGIPFFEQPLGGGVGHGGERHGAKWLGACHWW